MGLGDPATKGSYISDSIGAGTETPPPLELELDLITSARPNDNNKNIDDLPELLLVEILCRLGCNKFIFQSKCVSKRWCELISTPHFIRTFVRLQRDFQKPILSTLVMRDEFIPVLETTSRSKGGSPSLTLELPIIPDVQELYVLGACNDLLLCCSTQIDQHDYYICNPYSKKWFAVPHPNHVHQIVSIGFICDPYYNFVDDATSNSANIIEVNNEYRWRIVRIIPNFYVEIFFSETSEWRESVNVVSSSRRYYEVNSPGVAYNGKLYWSGSDMYTAFTIELDPFSSTSTTDGGIIVDKCRLTMGPLEWPYDERVPWDGLLHMCIGAISRGCLRACEREPNEIIRIWELDEGVDDLVVGTGDNLKWRLVEDTISFNQLEPCSDHSYSIGGSIAVLGFHPTNGDIMYVDNYFDIIMCNLGARTVAVVPEIQSQGEWNYKYIHPFVLPWWPTPVPRL